MLVPALDALREALALLCSISCFARLCCAIVDLGHSLMLSEALAYALDPFIANKHSVRTNQKGKPVDDRRIASCKKETVTTRIDRCKT